MKKFVDEVGKVYQTTKSGDVLVVEYFGNTKVLVRFLNTGFEKHFTLKNVRLGEVLDPTAKRLELLGKTYQTKNSGACRIIDYVCSREVLVEFGCGYKKWCELGQLKRGDVKNPYYPRIEGVGYIGEGVFSNPSETEQGRKAYQLWKNLLKRCYNKKFLQAHQTYEGCVVTEDWKNFNTFATWCVEQEGFFKKDKLGRPFQLDKDILGCGRVYSPETCCFIPSHLNTCFKNVKEPVTKLYNKWVVSSSKLGQSTKYFGSFETKEEAVMKHLEIKKALIESILKEYKGDMPSEVEFKVLEKMKPFDFEEVKLETY